MRLHLSRTTAFVALIAALMAVSGAAPPRQGGSPGRDRDRILRTTRGGPQRPDAVDGVTHIHDEHDLAPEPPGDGRLIAGSTPSPVPQLSPFHPAILPGALATLSAQFARIASGVDAAPAPLRVWQFAYAPDRAPPHA